MTTRVRQRRRWFVGLTLLTALHLLSIAPLGRSDDGHEGKVQYKGKWVTPEEKTNLEAGRVFYKGQWLLPEEKPFVDKGLVRYKQRWVTSDEKTNLENGLARFEGKWLKREEVDARRQQWANAWEVSNKHFLVRTNTSEDGAYAHSEKVESALLYSFGELSVGLGWRQEVSGRFEEKGWVVSAWRRF